MKSLVSLSSQKRFITTGLVAFGSLILFYLFPLDDSLNDMAQGLILGVVFLLVAPALYVKMILKEGMETLGLRKSDRRLAWLSVPLVTVSGLSILYLLIRIYPLEEGYYIPSLALGSFPIFLLYEILLVGAVAFLYEVFFRGFVQLHWLERFGWWGVPIQAALFAGFFLVTNGITWQDAPMMLAALSSGFVALYTRSIWYSFASAWLLLFLADTYLLTLG